MQKQSQEGLCFIPGPLPSTADPSKQSFSSEGSRQWEKHQRLFLATLYILTSTWLKVSIYVCCGLNLEWPPWLSSCYQSVLQLSGLSYRLWSLQEERPSWQSRWQGTGFEGDIFYGNQPWFHCFLVHVCEQASTMHSSGQRHSVMPSLPEWTEVSLKTGAQINLAGQVGGHSKVKVINTMCYK